MADQLDSEIDAILNDFSAVTDDGQVTCVWGSDEAKENSRMFLKAIIARACDKARIDELEKMQAMNGWHEGDWKQSMLDRIAQLKAEAAQKGEDRE